MAFPKTDLLNLPKSSPIRGLIRACNAIGASTLKHISPPWVFSVNVEVGYDLNYFRCQGISITDGRSQKLLSPTMCDYPIRFRLR